jgi:hypothetical protein
MPGMQRRPVAWLSALPLVAAGSLLAHSLAYRIVEPDPRVRAELLDGTGHGYLAYLPPLLAAALALLVAGLAGHVAAGVRRRPVPAPAWPLALVPPLAFALQEHLERLAAWGQLPLAATLEPTFLVGLAMQVPFAIAALLLARGLAGAAQALGRVLAAALPRPRAVRPPAAPLAADSLLPRIALLALGHAERGPPA